MAPEFILGLIILFIGSVYSAFPREKDYLTRLINLEIPGWGLLLIMLSYNEALALFTFGGVSVISTFVFVRVMEKRGAA
ncbi:MAG: EhaE family protein [Methanomicrobiales archaeon]|nr:EhaE family protein [Methanomicrobiales archaeon]